MGLTRAGRYAVLVAATAADLAVLRAPRHSIVLGAPRRGRRSPRRRTGRARASPSPAGPGRGGGRDRGDDGRRGVDAAADVERPVVVRDVWTHGDGARREPVRPRARGVPLRPVRAPGQPPLDAPGVGLRSALPRRRDRGSVGGGSVSALGARSSSRPSPRSRSLITLIVVWRTTRSLAALIFLGLNPVLVVIVVNGGHNDALIGLALLTAALLAVRRRPRAAGALIGLAALIKLTAGLALIGLVLWAWRHQLRRVRVRRRRDQRARRRDRLPAGARRCITRPRRCRQDGHQRITVELARRPAAAPRRVAERAEPAGAEHHADCVLLPRRARRCSSSV